MISRFHMRNFRSCPDWDFSLGKRTHIMGENGSGKTHILDVLHFLGGSSFVYSNTLIDEGALFEILFEDECFSKRYTFYQENKKGVYAFQGKKVTKPKYLQSLPFRTVFVSPFDMNLLYFAPGMRRDYMDSILERCFEQFRDTRRNYEGVMRQRNTLLKNIRDGKTGKQDLDFWDKKFSELAETYLLYRRKYTDFIQEKSFFIQQDLPKYTITFAYQSSIKEKEQYSGENAQETVHRYLRENRERDILTGHTHIGPHRDDFGFFIHKEKKNIPVEQFLSRGEMKMLLLALKRLEVKFLEDRINMPILLLVDDIFAELDDQNIQYFLNSLTTYQTILTSQKPLPEGENWNDFICINLKDI